MRDDTTSPATTARSRRAAADRAADGATARGRPLSRRARQTQRSVEAYLRPACAALDGAVEEIDQGIATEKRRWPAPTGRSARSARATRRLRGRWRALARRGASTTSTCSSSSTTTGIRSSASSRWTPHRATTCASRGAHRRPVLGARWILEHFPA
jgi:hypothetical protein